MPADPTALRALADRCETEEPSEQLVMAVLRALGWKCRGDVWWHAPSWQQERWEYAPCILTSIDAAASLMPEGWWMPQLRQEYGSIYVCFDRLDGKRASGVSRTESQARTAAALRAMAVEGEIRHDA